MSILSGNCHLALQAIAILRIIYTGSATGSLQWRCQKQTNGSKPMLIRIAKPSDVKTSDITPKTIFMNRRAFLATGAAGAGALALGAVPAAAAMLAQTGKLDGAVKWPLSTDEELTPLSKITSYNNFYEFGTDKGDPERNARFFNPRPWSVEIAGAAKTTGSFDIDEFVKPYTLEERVYRMRCVEAWSMVIPWVGIPLADIIKRYEPTGSAKFVAFETLFDTKRFPEQKRATLDWPYVEGLRMDEAMNPLTILAVGLYGDALPNQNGAPIRVVVPWKYGYKSIKSIVKISFQETMPPTTWNIQAPQEYGFYSNVSPAASHPRWSQATERRIGEFFRRDTLPYNGYAEEVASLYTKMDPSKIF
jgi:sulfoxide reductase catalytic subunit YedY